MAPKIRFKSCPRCSGDVVLMFIWGNRPIGAEQEWTCIACGWIDYEDMPLPKIRGDGSGSRYGDKGR